MEIRKKTEKIQKIIRKIASETNCDILDNRRLIFNQKPIIYYQPDFILLKKSVLIVIEIELSTDTRKAITGDIVRAGLLGARIFIGITKNSSLADTIEKYGDVLIKKINEISELKVFGISITDKYFSHKLRKILI